MVFDLQNIPAYAFNQRPDASPNSIGAHSCPLVLAGAFATAAE
jgi:hypothetical protein